VFHYVFQVPSNWSSPNASIGDPLKPWIFDKNLGNDVFFARFRVRMIFKGADNHILMRLPWQFQLLILSNPQFFIGGQPNDEAHVFIINA